MRAQSSEQEARTVAAEIDRMPRTREISERVRARVEACQTVEERRRWESLEMAISVTFNYGHEIGEREYHEWLELLEPRG